MVVHGEYPSDVRVARETRAAVAAGFDVDVVATRGRGQRPFEESDGVKVHRLPVSRRRHAALLPFIGEYLAFATLATVHVARLSLRYRPEVVQIHNPPDFLVAAALLPKLLGSKAVLDVHDLSSDMFAMRFDGRRGAAVAERLLVRLERLACNVADAVVTVHEPYREQLVSRGVDPAKIVVVLNSVDEGLLPAERRPPSREPLRIVYHGTVTPHYGLSLLVEALARLPERLGGATVEILGGGDAVQSLTEQAEALGVASRVELTGTTLPQTDVLKRIQGAAVGVVPNLPVGLNRFALSAKLFEYVVLGIPVVAADLPTLRSHFSSDEICYFRAGDADSLAQALERIADDYDGALARARAAYERYAASYEWRRQAERYTAMLERLAGRVPKSGGARPRREEDG